ncbi:MAG: tripartite tricarboxylate transporter receptor family protein [Ramlibacter sp.]|nr:tripartite tricarboxylate transporter receptor family protein [Ramlibacter sp.]
MAISKRYFLATLLSSGLSVGYGQTYPSRSITLYCPWPPGGSGDAQLRLLAKLAGAQLKQSVVIENRPGAAGAMGAAAVVRAKADGYTLSQSHNGSIRYPYMVPNAPYDPNKDFTYILGISDNPFGLVVRSDSPWQTLDQFLKHAQQTPGAVSVAVPGTGSPGHLVADQIAAAAKIQWNVIPFKGTADSMNSLLGGHVTAAAESTGWATYVDSGRLRLLGVFTDRRMKKYPNVPTLKEAGINASDFSPWGIVGPAGMDPAVVRTLHDAFKAAMEHPEFAALLTSLSQQTHYMTGDEYRKYVAEAAQHQKGVVEKYNLRQS